MPYVPELWDGFIDLTEFIAVSTSSEQELVLGPRVRKPSVRVTGPQWVNVLACTKGAEPM